MRPNSRGTSRLNGCRLLWLPPGDLVDTAGVPSCENHETGRESNEGVSHMNMRNGSFASFTISKRGKRSFAMGVAVCLRESVGGESQRVASSDSLVRILEYLFHSFSACFSAT